VADAMFQARLQGMPTNARSRAIGAALLEYLESNWNQPDEGIWEVRGPRQHFTHSKVMAWVAFDRAVKAVQQLGVEGPVERWIALRDRIHDEVCRNAFDPALNSFVQAYGSKTLDASLLLMPLVGFLPVDDPRVAGTLAAIERRLVFDDLEPSSPAAYGMPTISSSRVEERMRVRCSSGFSRFGMTLGCWLRNTILEQSGRWEITHRRSAMSRWSIQR
jgi:hypothetical protein